MENTNIENVVDPSSRDVERDFGEGKIIVYNAIKTPDGTVLVSKHRHDYVAYTDKNGQYYAVDGGSAYLKRMFDKRDYEELSMYSDDDHATVRGKFSWGTFGKNGDEPKHWILLKDMTVEHIKAILDTQSLQHSTKDLFLAELQYRIAAVPSVS